MLHCLLCEKKTVQTLLDFGPQPVSNRFLTEPARDEYTHPLLLGQCFACGLLQLIDPVPAVELIPPYEWMTYNEPEEHLDALADILESLPGLDKNAVICGISFKDDTLLRRMDERGFANTWRIDPQKDLSIAQRAAGVETIQDRLVPETAKGVAAKHGRADIVIARHILEHAADMPRFMAGLKKILNHDGYLVIEAPCCERALNTLDYAALWEEHLAYFTSFTFRNALALLGCKPFRIERYEYPSEDSLVGICRISDDEFSHSETDFVPAGELEKGSAFARGFSSRKKAVNEYLYDFQKQKGGIALFGAGHVACVFADLFDLSEIISFVADDNPHKIGLFMPGSKLPVRPSSDLLTENIGLGLLCLSPESESKVMQRNNAFIRAGGRFASIVPSSARALEVLKDDYDRGEGTRQ